MLSPGALRGSEGQMHIHGFKEIHFLTLRFLSMPEPRGWRVRPPLASSLPAPYGELPARPSREGGCRVGRKCLLAPDRSGLYGRALWAQRSESMSRGAMSAPVSQRRNL